MVPIQALFKSGCITYCITTLNRMSGHTHTGESDTCHIFLLDLVSEDLAVLIHGQLSIESSLAGCRLPVNALVLEKFSFSQNSFVFL